MRRGSSPGSALLCVLVCLVYLAAGAGAGASPRTHRVKKGETLGHIALGHGCTVEELRSANKDALGGADTIKPGQQLNVPRCKAGPAAAKAGGPAPGKEAPARGDGHHVVQNGESLWTIAARYGCSQKELLRANRSRISDPRLIQVEQELRIPRCSGRGKTGETPARGLPTTNCTWDPDDFQVGKLHKLMLAEGFNPPEKFRAMVVETVLSADQRRVLGHRLYSYGKLAWEPWGWNPASTVKLFSAISALELLRKYGFGVNTRVTYHYKSGHKTFAVKDLFEDAVHWSKNIPHNRLVQLAGHDFLNGPGGTLQRAGLEHTYIMRAYAQSSWEAEGHSRYLQDSPGITLREGKRRRTLPARRGKGRYPCGGAACSSLSDLAKTMCRMMLHEQLPRHKRLGLGNGAVQSPHLKLLRSSMDRKRQGRSDAVWDVFARAFPAAQGFELFRKAGFSQDWLSENIYIYNPNRKKRWIVTMAGYPGRGCLTSAARVIATLIQQEKL